MIIAFPMVILQHSFGVVYKRFVEIRNLADLQLDDDDDGVQTHPDGSTSHNFDDASTAAPTQPDTPFETRGASPSQLKAPDALDNKIMQNVYGGPGARRSLPAG